MTTDRQYQANRANARKSTGPRTSAGKALVRLNATRHGLTAAAVVVPGIESPAEWAHFRAGVVDSLKPVGSFAEALVGRAVELLWRLRRATRFESLSIAADQAALQVPARPLSDRAELERFDDQDEMTDAECLAHRAKEASDKRVWAADARLALLLAERLAGLDNAGPVDERATDTFLAECVERAAVIGATDRVNDLEGDAAAIRAAGGLTPGAPRTAAAVRQAVAVIARGMKPRQAPADFLAAMVDHLPRVVAEADEAAAETEGEVQALRQRTAMNAAIATARRAGVGAEAADRIARYEGHLSRQLRDVLDQLDRLRTLA